jgi:amidase
MISNDLWSASASDQIIGQRYREDLCLAAAQAIEDRLGSFTPI